MLAQAIKTDTDGIIAGDQVVKIGGYEMPEYEGKDYSKRRRSPDLQTVAKKRAGAPSVPAIL